MKTVRVEFSLEVLDDMTDSEIEAFVSFHIGATSELKGDNPMIDMALEAKPGSVWIIQ